MEISNEIKLEDKCAIIVNSCDAYEDVWELFFHALKDQWPNCILDIYLNTENKTYKFDGLNLREFDPCLKLSVDTPWGKRLIRVLGAVDKEFVISLFDDFILEDKVNINKVVQCAERMLANENIAVFYFNNIPGKNFEDELFEEFELVGKRNDYRLNSAPALWRREKLIEFTGEMDNPWAWELFGSARTYSKNDLFYCAKKNFENTFIYNYELGGAIRRGKWVYRVVTPLIKKYGLNIDLNKRGIAGESLAQGKYSLKWKIDFFILGYRMIGFSVCIFLYRILKKKILRR